MKKIIPFLIVLFLLFNFSCKKKCEVIDELPHEFLAYWYFNQGSWWVYQLKDTINVFDTVTITKSELFENGVEPDGNQYACTEYGTLISSHSSALFSDHISNLKIEMFTSISNGDKVNYLVSNGGYNNKTIYYLGYSMIDNFNMDGGEEGWVLLDKLSVEAPLDTFVNILHYKCYDTLHYYFSKNIGVVKRKTSDNKIWELVNYNVTQNF